jgi:nucleotide-binding universal stress UspA family protein
MSSSRRARNLRIEVNQEVTMYKNILIPTDGSELAGEAVKHGIAFAKAVGAKITALTVTEPFPVFAVNPEVLTDTPKVYEKHARQHAEATLSKVSSAAKAAGVACQIVHAEGGHAFETIIKTAQQQGCDLILMASHGRRGVSAIVLGSETVRVLTHSKIPVLVYR